MDAAIQTQRSPADSSASETLLEDAFPYADVSRVARRDRYSRDHTYSIHKWWARRPPAVIRALLLASVLPAGTTPEVFWRIFAGEGAPLDGLLVGDPFMGGATTLVEAARLGADVSGIDVDPLAVRIASAELAHVDTELLLGEGRRLLVHLTKSLGALYPNDDAVATPLHYFWLRRVTCQACEESALLHRDLYLVRDRGRDGAVVRGEAGVAFCPDCLRLHRLRTGQTEVRCCGRRRRLEEGTYRRQRFVCPSCGARARNEELKVGRLPRVLVAIEETVPDGYRRLRSPTASDHAALASADRRVARRKDRIPGASIGDIDGGRPASYGFQTIGDLFTARQQVVFSDAFAWVNERVEAPGVQQLLQLAVSNALGANNLLCGYATEYGRLSALFSGVRAYSMPVLSVELNPLHPTAGRGTLAMTLRRTARAQCQTVTRHVRDSRSGEVVQTRFPAGARGRWDVACRSSDRKLPTPFGPFDLVLTDPPYFDFIPYSDLSLLYRAWLGHESEEERLSGTPIYPVGADAAEQFASRLGRSFRKVRAALKPNAPMVFTFHSSHDEAWSALERALRQGEFMVTAVFPVWADGRSGGHGHAGNCEWDLVFVCRVGTQPHAPIEESAEHWFDELGDDITIEQSDRRSMELGLAMASRLRSETAPETSEETA